MISTVDVVLPPLLVAVMVYVVAALAAVGVPLMTPVVVFKLKPAGKAGLILYETTAPPPTVGVKLLIAAPTLNVLGVV